MNAEELYESLNKIYSTTYSDRAEERDSAIKMLQKAINQGVEPDHMIYKMNQMNEINSGPKGKLYSTILGKFWERQFKQMIPYRKFKFDD